MEQNKTLSTKNVLTIIFFGAIAMLLALGISFWQTPKYKSSIKLLTVFNQTNIDAYTASKTANYITSVLGEVIYSDSFIESVMKSGNIDDNLGYGSENRQKNWKKKVKTSVLENKGIIIVETYSDNKSETVKLAEVIGNTLVSQHGNYDGAADRVELKMIDMPTSYEKWSMIKILQDTGMGFIAGLLFGLTFIVIFPNHKLFDFKKKQFVAIPGYQPNYNYNQFNNQAATQNSYSSQSNNPWLSGYNPESDGDKGQQ